MFATFLNLVLFPLSLADFSVFLLLVYTVIISITALFQHCESLQQIIKTKVLRIYESAIDVRSESDLVTLFSDFTVALPLFISFKFVSIFK